MYNYNDQTTRDQRMGAVNLSKLNIVLGVLLIGSVILNLIQASAIERLITFN